MHSLHNGEQFSYEHTLGTLLPNKMQAMPITQGSGYLGAEGGQIAKVSGKYPVDRGFISWHLAFFLFFGFFGRLFHLSLGLVSITLSPYGRHSRLPAVRQPPYFFLRWAVGGGLSEVLNK